jgi:hypothetical protein
MRCLFRASAVLSSLHNSQPHILPKGVTQTAVSAIDGKMVDVKNEKITAIYTIFNA